MKPSKQAAVLKLPPKQRTFYSAEYKRNVCAQYQSSGLSVRQFSDSKGLKYTTFKNWLHRYEPEIPAFIPMQMAECSSVLNQEPTPPSIHLVLHRGSSRIELQLPASAQSACLQWLGEFLK